VLWSDQGFCSSCDLQPGRLGGCELAVGFVNEHNGGLVRADFALPRPSAKSRRAFDRPPPPA
jgi:hypothetical protein